jgi:hypothetical protein
MARRRKTGDYRGELRQLIILPDPHMWQRRFNPRGPFLLTGEMKAREAAIIERAIAVKLPPLFAHFGIRADDPNRWQRLALALARKHVPGFQAARGTGAPVKESVELLCRLYRYFIRAKANRNRRHLSRKATDADVCRVLFKDNDFKHAIPELESSSPKRLQNLVAKAKKLRRARVTDILNYFAYKRRLGPNGLDEGFFHGDPVPWISDRPSSAFLKYGGNSRSRRQK